MPASSVPDPLSRRAFLHLLAGMAAPHPDADPMLDVAASGAITFDTPILTPNERFFRPPMRTSIPPPLDRRTWTLYVGGLVERPLELTYDALRAMPSIGQARTLVRQGNRPGGEQIGTAIWQGCPLIDLLAEAGIRAEARSVRFDSADGGSISLPLELVRAREVLLAYGMNGAVLPPAHGFPVRALVPGLYDHLSPAWLVRIVLSAEEPPAEAARLAVRPSVHILTPRLRSQVSSGEVVAVQGVAFAGERPIGAVRISIDGGDRVPAVMRPPDSPHAWTQWYVRWRPELPGGCTITARAIETAEMAGGWAAPLHPDSRSGQTDAVHSIVVEVE